MLVSTHRRAIISEIIPEREPLLDDQLKLFDQSGLDLILVEGFKAEQFSKIELHRPSLNKPLLYPNDPTIIAIASDEVLEVPSHLTRLDINQPEMIAVFILKQFMGHL
jgi:molybdopterin-guanine dinucleotide biosynthesis protein B